MENKLAVAKGAGSGGCGYKGIAQGRLVVM